MTSAISLCLQDILYLVSHNMLKTDSWPPLTQSGPPPLPSALIFHHSTTEKMNTMPFPHPWVISPLLASAFSKLRPLESPSVFCLF